MFTLKVRGSTLDVRICKSLDKPEVERIVMFVVSYLRFSNVGQVYH